MGERRLASMLEGGLPQYRGEKTLPRVAGKPRQVNEIRAPVAGATRPSRSVL